VGYLSFEVHFSVKLAATDVLDGVQDALARLSPGFCADLRVMSYERDRDVRRIVPGLPLRRAVVEKGLQRGDTYRSLVQKARPPRYDREFGDVIVRGSAPRTNLYIRFDDLTPAKPVGENWLFSNSIAGQVGPAMVCGVPRTTFVFELVAELGSLPDTLWGAAHDDTEFRSRNLYDEPDGMWALGRDIRRSLPGLYWLNLFGQPYRDLIGDSTLATTPEADVHNLGDALLIKLWEEPKDWGTDLAIVRHQRALEHLGPEFFFDREQPNRATTAPDFGLTPLPSRPPMQAFSSDGTTFTVLPSGDDG
jgi:hypothetical protein